VRNHLETIARLATTSQLQISKVGFPIRKFTDQSLFAAPHDLSQRTTSFIASQRQGIHRIPLRHLIALITNAHRSAATTRSTADAFAPSAVQEFVQALISNKDQFCFKHIRELCGQAKPTTENARGITRLVAPQSFDRMCFLFTMSDIHTTHCACRTVRNWL
jgi:hypothetical protein